jgi:hypothetical protein
VRPVGWRYDSHRHSLSSRGIKTGKHSSMMYMEVYPEYFARRRARLRFAGSRELYGQQPPLVERDAVSVGNEVEVLAKGETNFKYPGSDRLRVRVMSIRGRKLSGKVLSLPRFASVMPGGNVVFTRANIVSIRNI